MKLPLFSRTPKRRSAASVAVLVSASLGCTDRAPLTANEATPVLGEHVVGEAALGLDRSGRFVLPTPPASEEAISAENARSFAAAWWTRVHPFIAGQMQRDRGARIHPERLTACPRAYYARSAYESRPTGERPAIRKMAAGHWLVGMCDQEVQVVVIAVSALATDIVLDQRGQMTSAGSANFFAHGVPVGASIPVTPEAAVVLAAEGSGRRVARIPSLSARPYPHSPVNAVWAIELEADVALKSTATNSRTTSRHLVVGHLDGWARPTLGASRETPDGAPREQLIEFRGPPNSRIGNRSIRFTRRAAVSTALELVNVEGR